MAAKFKIIYEDNMLLVADKPAGLLSQGDTSGSDNLLDILKKYLKEKYRRSCMRYASGCLASHAS